MSNSPDVLSDSLVSSTAGSYYDVFFFKKKLSCYDKKVIN